MARRNKQGRRDVYSARVPPTPAPAVSVLFDEPDTHADEPITMRQPARIDSATFEQPPAPEPDPPTLEHADGISSEDVDSGAWEDPPLPKPTPPTFEDVKSIPRDPVRADEPLDLTSPIVVSVNDWNAFVDALEAPPCPAPALVEMLAAPCRRGHVRARALVHGLRCPGYTDGEMRRVWARGDVGEFPNASVDGVYLEAL